MKTRKGQTLVEVMVATVIAASTATAIFSVVLSSHVGELKSDKKEAAAMVIKAAQEQLKIYVSADPSDPEFSPVAGGHWGKDTNGGWALATGSHNVDLLLAGVKQLEGKNTAPTLTYVVANVNCGFCSDAACSGAPDQTLACKQVTLTLTYED